MGKGADCGCFWWEKELGVNLFGVDMGCGVGGHGRCREVGG